jgi:hypothetical protein
LIERKKYSQKIKDKIPKNVGIPISVEECTNQGAKQRKNKSSKKRKNNRTKDRKNEITKERKSERMKG